MCCGWGGMMGGWGGWPGWGGMMGGWGIVGWIFGLLFNLGLLALLVIGIVWLVRQVRGSVSSSQGQPPANPATSGGGRTCPTCGRPMAPEWTVCPYDGTPLATGSSEPTA